MNPVLAKALTAIRRRGLYWIDRLLLRECWRYTGGPFYLSPRWTSYWSANFDYKFYYGRHPDSRIEYCHQPFWWQKDKVKEKEVWIEED